MDNEYQSLFERLMKIADIDSVDCVKTIFGDYCFQATSSRLRLQADGKLFSNIEMCGIYLKFPIYSVSKFLIDYAIEKKTEIIFWIKIEGFIGESRILIPKVNILIPKVNNLEELKIWLDLHENEV